MVKYALLCVHQVDSIYNRMRLLKLATLHGTLFLFIFVTVLHSDDAEHLLTLNGLFHCSQTRESLDKCWALSYKMDASSLGVHAEGAWPRLARMLSFHIMAGWSFWGEFAIWLTAKWENPRFKCGPQHFCHSVVWSWYGEFLDPLNNFVFTKIQATNLNICFLCLRRL